MLLRSICISAFLTIAFTGIALAQTSEETSKVNGYNVLSPAGPQGSKLDNYDVLSPAGPQASKFNNYDVLSPTGPQASKFNTYFVLLPPPEYVSKLNGYSVLQIPPLGSEGVSKLNGYSVLQIPPAGGEGVSKLNAYAVISEVFPNVTILQSGGALVAGGGAGSTWNPSDKNAAITLSSGNLVATQNSVGSTWRSVRGSKGYATGTSNKVVFTLTSTLIDGPSGWLGGVADASMSLASYVGASGKSWGVQACCGAYNSGNTGGSGGCSGFNASGQTIYYAIDFNTGKLWCSTSCTAWGGGTTPDSGNTPNVTLAGSDTFYPAWSGYGSPSDVSTLNTTPTLSGCTGVSTFTPWN